MHGKSESKEKKGQWLNIILAVVILAFITFMIISTYWKSKLAEADKLLNEETEESQDKHIKSALEDGFDPDYENVKILWTSFKKHEAT